MDFSSFYKWAYRYLGIDLSAYKQTQLTRRIESLMRRVGVNTLDEYIKLIEKDENQKMKFLDFITINVTEFFRNPEIFNQLESVLKNQYFSKNKQINIWSAACSIGCEPYSLAMILKENNVKNFNIFATDIDMNVIAKAKKGIYTDVEVKNMDKKYLKYFTLKNQKYILSEEIKSIVSFSKGDLILDDYKKNFDLIVCRNVVIYFNSDVKDKIYIKFNQSLNKDGLLFIGATENIYDSKKVGFERSSTFIYRKI